MIKKPIQQIYFAFPDGVFHHVCAECTALCCRGLGFGGSMSREMPYLLKRYPSISAMVLSRSGDLVRLATPLGGCTFVQEDNRCRIEAECGKARKPLVCVLFPFNNLHRLGNAVMVSPHFHCPLRLQIPSRVGEVEGTHERIHKVLLETGVLDETISSSWMNDLKTPKHQTTSVIIDRETLFRDRCASALGKERFSKVVEEASDDLQDLRKFKRRAAKLMSWPQRRCDRDGFDDVLLAIAPALRIMNINNTAEHELRFLSLAESLVREYFADAQSVPTPQSIHSVIQHALPGLRLLSYADAPLKTHKKNLIGPLRSPELVFATSTALRRLSSNGVLTALEGTIDHLRARADRLTVLNELARFSWTPV